MLMLLGLPQLMELMLSNYPIRAFWAPKSHDILMFVTKKDGKLVHI